MPRPARWPAEARPAGGRGLPPPPGWTRSAEASRGRRRPLTEQRHGLVLRQLIERLGRVRDRQLGLLLTLDGLGWPLFLWPPLATFLFPAIAVASGLAEAPLQLWLLAFGVNPRRWEEQAALRRQTA
jgi:hypothetical protein